MGASKKEFINCRMAHQDYLEIPNYLRERIEVKSVDDVLPEYKDDETLKGLYRESAKLKDKIKIRQFEIKDNLNKVK
jgi:hypothetical protein